MAEITYKPTCEHERYELRIHTYVNGIKNYKLMCLVCGARGGAIPKTHDMVTELWTDPPEIDQDLRDSWFLEENMKYQEERQRENDQWWDEYTEYLNSEEWQKKRKLVLDRDKFICQARMNGCIKNATHVHHLTYKHRFNEPLFDLIAVCEFCHIQITAIDRSREAA